MSDSYLAKYTAEIRQLGNAYYQNPDDIELAVKYSSSLADSMNVLNNRIDSFIAPQHLLKSLTEVYYKHFNNEDVAVNYLSGISAPRYMNEGAVNKLRELVKQFPENDTAKVHCANGLAIFVKICVDRKDLDNAKRITGYLEEMHNRYPTNNSITHGYANALFYTCTIQGYFEKRNTASKLKKLAEQYPNSKHIKYLCESF